jgi:hypothetical protein
MKLPWLLPVAALSAACTLVSCGTPNKKNDDQFKANGPRSGQGESRFLQDDSNAPQPPPGTPNALPQTGGNTPPATTTAPENPTAPPAPATPPPAKTQAGNATPPVPPPPSGNQYPYAKPVPGKKGFVYSPFDEKQSEIDVRDYAPGTKVRDPYTNRIFLVP